MKELIEVFQKQHLTIGSCESLTAGLFASSIAEVPGASAVLKGGIITYWTQCKINVVHVDARLIEAYGVVSEECAKAMAVQARKLLDVDVCVSFTGNAGPDTMDGKPAGLVYAAIDGIYGTLGYEFFLQGDRNRVRRDVVQAMKKQVINYIEMKGVKENGKRKETNG